MAHQKVERLVGRITRVRNHRFIVSIDTSELRVTNSCCWDTAKRENISINKVAESN